MNKNRRSIAFTLTCQVGCLLKINIDKILLHSTLAIEENLKYTLIVPS